MSTNPKQPEASKDKLLKGAPHLIPISQALSSVTQVPGFWSCSSAEERDEFERRWIAEESEKWYGAIDSGGRIYQTRNPALMRHRDRVGTAHGMPLVDYAKAVCSASSETAATNPPTRTEIPNWGF